MAKFEVILLTEGGRHAATLGVDHGTVLAAHSLVYKGKHYAYMNQASFSAAKATFREVAAPVELSDETEVVWRGEA